MAEVGALMPGLSCLEEYGEPTGFTEALKACIAVSMLDERTVVCITGGQINETSTPPFTCKLVGGHAWHRITELLGPGLP